MARSIYSPAKARATKKARKAQAALRQSKDILNQRAGTVAPVRTGDHGMLFCGPRDMEKMITVLCGRYYWDCHELVARQAGVA